MHRYLAALALLAVSALAACEQAPTASLSPDAPAFGKSSTAPRLSFVFADLDGHKIRSDGRGTYSDGTCGTLARISNLADAVLDPDKDYRKSSSCPTPRAIRIDLGASSYLEGSYVTIHNLWNITSSTPTMTRMAFTTSSATGCGSIRFGFNADGTTAASGGVQVTKVASSPNTWVVETDPNSVAECWNSSGGTTTRTVIEGGLPFRLTLTQL